MDSTTVALGEKITLEIVKNLPALLWFLLACAIVILFYKPLRHELLPNIRGLKAMGLELTFVKRSLTDSFKQAFELGKKFKVAGRGMDPNNPWQIVTIARKDRQRVFNRVKRNLRLLHNVYLLWIDDMPESLHGERKMLQDLHVEIDLARSTAEAEQFLQINHYDIILSDIARGNDRKAGIEFLMTYAQREKRAPVIFYVGYFQPEKGVPPYAFGITHRPDELLHLILDALERKQV
jgi:hypothetical protein